MFYYYFRQCLLTYLLLINLFDFCNLFNITMEIEFNLNNKNNLNQILLIYSLFYES